MKMWQALGESWYGSDPYLAHWLQVSVFLLVMGVLLLLVLDVRRMAGRRVKHRQRRQDAGSDAQISSNDCIEEN
jgi:heme exporter protein D